MGCSVDADRSRIGLFVAVLMKSLTRNTQKAAGKVRGLRVTSFSALLAVSCLLAMLLIGYVEPNPGLTPTKHTDEPREHDSDSSSSMQKEASGLPNGASSAHSDTDASDLQYLSSAVQAMTSAITRLEEGQRQLTSAMTQQFASIQYRLDARFHQMGEEQHVLHLDVDKLHSKQERLEQENANLRNTVQQLASKVEALDMEKRKRNLLFFGKPIREGVSCEQLVGDVLQTHLGITDTLDMDQARRVGSGILVTFQSLKQKVLVLSRARLLTPAKAVSVREEFPEAVRRRRGVSWSITNSYAKTRRRPSSDRTSCLRTTEYSPATYSSRWSSDWTHLPSDGGRQPPIHGTPPTPWGLHTPPTTTVMPWRE